MIPFSTTSVYATVVWPHATSPATSPTNDGLLGTAGLAGAVESSVIDYWWQVTIE